jgi:putative transposase
MPMPRYRRLFLPDIPLHIVQRGHDRQPVFVEPSDYVYYLSNLAEAKVACEISVHAYCLMTNHVHLLVSPGQQADQVSVFMRILAARQTRYANRKEKRSGTLWEGRFKPSLVDSFAYLLACYRYIELNPVSAGIVSSPDEYGWSSYGHNSGKAHCDWLDTHEEYAALGTDRETRQTAYRAFVGQGVSDEERDRIHSALNRCQVTGNDRFRAALERRTGRRLSVAAPGRPRKK